MPSADAAALRVLIPQEAYVHTGTLAENLGHLRADPVPEPELLAAARAVGLTPLLEALGGPRTSVDPATLSAGERQLVALTRAYLSYAPSSCSTRPPAIWTPGPRNAPSGPSRTGPAPRWWSSPTGSARPAAPAACC